MQERIRLKDTFSKYRLTSGQNDLLGELEEFLSNDSSCFLLKGYAGTGKTFMMKGLTDFLRETNKHFVIAAPTGRAAKVIAQKTKHKAYTIHKTVYSNKFLKETKVKNESGTETFKFYFELKNNEESNSTVYIIDEASMLSDAYSEGEFFRFGSGFLLQDLIKYINFEDKSHTKKIIFIGDSAQLPPVNMNFSPALDRKYLKDNCNLISSEFELSEVVRQKTESGVLHNASKLRKSLKGNIFNQLEIGTNFKDIHKTKQEDFLSKYLNACNHTIDEETIIVSHSNATVREYNQLVRNHFFPNQGEIMVRDKVILVSNNYNYPQIELMNGDFGSVKEVSPLSESRTITLKRKNEKQELVETKVPLTFREVTITFTDEEDNNHDVHCKIIENLLYSSHRDLSSDELKAIYLDFKIRTPKLKVGTTEFKDAIRTDAYFNALRIKFGYAVTCHKAQGGEWKNTFLNCKTSMGYSNASYFRWLYTGITRAKENLYLMDAPHFTIGSDLQKPKMENMQAREDVLSLNSKCSDIDLPFDLSSQSAFVKQIYHAVSECLKDQNINIRAIRHTNYLEHYSLSHGNEIVVFKIHYNGQNKITSILKPTKSTDLAEKVYKKLLKLQNQTVVLEATDIKKEEFVFEQDFQKDFYENLKQKLEPEDFHISKIEHKQYHEIYEISKDGYTATYKFWYNGKFKFKKTEIIPSRTTGLVEEINALLN